MGCQPLASFLSFRRIVFVDFSNGLLHVFERPAEDFGEFSEKRLLCADGRRWGLGIFEPGEDFAGGGWIAGGGAFGRVGL